MMQPIEVRRFEGDVSLVAPPANRLDVELLRRRGKIGINPLPFLVWRSPAFALVAACDRALATGPVGMIDLTTPGSIGCRLDV
eukprot:1912010-Prymnesium_polylepis.1